MNAYRELQDNHCDMSRGTDKGARILRNVGEMAQYFPIHEPVLCVGCGDGLEVEAWRLLGYDAKGLELSGNKAAIAAAHGVYVTEAPAEDLELVPGRFNIYCAHTLEHCRDAAGVLEAFGRKAISTVCVIVPVEVKGTKNPSHLSPVVDLSGIRIPGMVEDARWQRWNNEPEGVIVWKRKAAAG